MSAILQGVLGGNRALLVGWFLPTAINVLLFGALIDPRLSGFSVVSGSSDGGGATRPTVYVLTGTLVVGLLLAALQTLLYRILEGYLGWPRRMAEAGTHRHTAYKHLLQSRLDAAGLVQLERAGTLTGEQHAALQAFRAHRVTARYVEADCSRGPIWLAVLEERLRRYPIDDQQVAPTSLGNAIRRLEEYGYNRFRLDTQLLWHELITVVPEQARRHVEDARIGVDFFVCLLSGHLLAILAAVVELAFGHPQHPWRIAAVAVGLLAASVVWYRTAIVATDEWTASVRALVNLGRKPLADALGLKLPDSLDDERGMWAITAELTVAPYAGWMSQMDHYRATLAAQPTPNSPTAANTEPETPAPTPSEQASAATNSAGI